MVAEDDPAGSYGRRRSKAPCSCQGVGRFLGHPTPAAERCGCQDSPFGPLAIPELADTVDLAVRPRNGGDVFRYRLHSPGGTTSEGRHTPR
jgi:hypothetical protein